MGDIGLPLVRVGPDGELGYMPVWSRLASDHLAAALPLGLRVRRCEEPRRPSPLVGDEVTDLHDGVAPSARRIVVRTLLGRRRSMTRSLARGSQAIRLSS